MNGLSFRALDTALPTMASESIPSRYLVPFSSSFKYDEHFTQKDNILHFKVILTDMHMNTCWLRLQSSKRLVSTMHSESQRHSFCLHLPKLIAKKTVNFSFIKIIIRSTASKSISGLMHSLIVKQDLPS